MKNGAVEKATISYGWLLYLLWLILSNFVLISQLINYFFHILY